MGVGESGKEPIGRLGVALLVGGWAVAAVYVGAHIDRGWVPHDEGLLAQTATRVMAGELPHRDFVDAYTGGLTYFHALVFGLLGTKLLSLRVSLLLATIAWAPAVYYVARRFTGPAAAAAGTLLAIVWSVPNYPAAVPSWYNLFLATFGTAALLRFIETDRGRWLLVAGLCGGLSVLVKITGLFYVAGALLFLAFREQHVDVAPEGGSSRGYRTASGTAVVAWVASLFALELRRAGGREFVHFVLPGALLALYVLWHEEREPKRSGGARFASLGRSLGPFAAGIVLPIALFLLPFALGGALDDLYAGVFIAPTARIGFAALRPPAIAASLFATLPMVFLLGHPSLDDAPATVRAGIAATLLTGVIAAASQPFAYQLIWYSVRSSVPIVVAAGVVVLMHPVTRERVSGLRRQQLLLLLAVTSMVSLVQFPFSAPIYFTYTAPFAILSVMAVLSSVRPVRGFAPTAVCIFYLAFGVFLVNRVSIYNMSLAFRHDGQTDRLALERAGIRVTPADAEEYQRLVSVVSAHAHGDAIYAAPDAPEVYFLSDKRNPTRDLFEFLNTSPPPPEETLDLLTRNSVDVVVVNRSPSFSDRLSPALRRSLEARYPDSVAVGRFTVRWRP